MALEGLARVQARIAEIEQQLSQLGSAVAPPSTPVAQGNGPGLATFAPASADSTATTYGASGAGTDTTGATFSNALQNAYATTVMPARVRAPGTYGPIQAPAALAQYGNGRIPPPLLTALGDGTNSLWGPAANAFKQLRADAASSGVTMKVDDSYRSYDRQVQRASQVGLYSDGGLAASPGTSAHGWGLAVDLQLDDKAQTWMRANAWRYGFVEAVAREPWHWEFRPGS